MEAHTKSYKTELIVAIITALTGVTISIVSNWDKLTNDGSKAKTERTSDFSPTPEFNDFKETKLFKDALFSANEYTKENYHVEMLQYAKVFPETVCYFTFTFIPDYDYHVELYSFDKTLQFKLNIMPTDSTGDIISSPINSDVSVTVNVRGSSCKGFYLFLKEVVDPVNVVVLIARKKA